jgi:cytochrome P450
MITDLMSAEAVRDPHTAARLLREHAPVVWLPEHRAWFVATFADVLAGFHHPGLSSDRLSPMEARLPEASRAALGPTLDLLRGWMVFHDPPHHERLKDPVRRAFTPRTIEALRPFVTDVVDRCVEQVLDRARDGDLVDLIAELAFPLPAIVIAELLGVPASDRDAFKTWSSELATIVFGASTRAPRTQQAALGTAHFTEYFTELIRHYEQHPADNLICALLAARHTADPPLQATELVGACTLLLFGGHETTTSLLGNSMVSLFTHPDQRAWLAAHPEAIVGAAEELHRFDGSSKVMVRVAADTVELGGATIEPGSSVFLGLAAANRDPAAFERPDELWLARPDAARHLGYGHGLHFCLGAPLARLETQVALTAFAERLGPLQLAIDPQELPWGATILGRGLQRLPVAWEP